MEWFIEKYKRWIISRMEHDLSVILSWALNPVDTGRKLNVHKTFKKRPGTS